MEYKVLTRNGGARRYPSFEDLEADIERWDKSITVNTANKILMPIYRNGDIIGVALGMI